MTAQPPYELPPSKTSLAHPAASTCASLFADVNSNSQDVAEHRHGLSKISKMKSPQLAASGGG